MNKNYVYLLIVIIATMVFSCRTPRTISVAPRETTTEDVTAKRVEVQSDFEYFKKLAENCWKTDLEGVPTITKAEDLGQTQTLFTGHYTNGAIKLEFIQTSEIVHKTVLILTDKGFSGYKQQVQGFNSSQKSEELKPVIPLPESESLYFIEKAKKDFPSCEE